MAATVQVEFIAVNPGIAIGVNDNARRRIRVQVMRDFRRKEREQKAGAAQKRKTIKTTDLPAPRPPPQIHSPAINQAALTQALRDGWFPIGFGFSTLIAQRIGGFNIRESAPVLAILDTLKLLHLGSTVHDERVTIEGRKRFLTAMNCLRLNVRLKNPKLAIVGLMLVAMGISMSEMYTTISPNSRPLTWQTQVVGMSALVLRRQPVDMESKLEVFMTARFRMAQLSYSLCSRKPFPAKYAAPAIRSSVPNLDILLDLAFRLPPLLAAVDSLVESSPFNDPEQEVLSKHLASLEQAFLAWRGIFCKATSFTHSNDHCLDSDHSQSIMITKETSSSSIFGLSCEMLCRVCLLLISRSHLQLDQNDSRKIVTERRLLSVAMERAEQLRQTTLRLSIVAERPVCRALALRAPLHFLEEWYHATEDLAGMQWCLDMQDSVQKKAPYLNWDAVLPWSLISLVKVTV